MNKEKIVEFVGSAIIFVIIAALIAALVAIPIMLLWSLIIPAVFPGLVSEGYITDNIGFFQSIGLYLLFTILFKNFSTKR